MNILGGIVVALALAGQVLQPSRPWNVRPVTEDALSFPYKDQLSGPGMTVANTVDYLLDVATVTGLVGPSLLVTYSSSPSGQSGTCVVALITYTCLIGLPVLGNKNQTVTITALGLYGTTSLTKQLLYP